MPEWKAKEETEERETGASGAFLRSETEEIRERANLTTDAEALRGIGDYSSGFCGVVENRAGRTELMSNEAKRI